MNQRNLTFAWLGSILILSVFAGLNWLEVGLTPEAGGQIIEVTGYLAFPIISALILLQAASLLASFFTPVIIGRWIAGLLAPVMLIHGALIFIRLDDAIALSLSGAISEITGVAGSSSQLQFVESSTTTFLWVGYLAAVALNLLVLIGKALMNVGKAKAITPADSSDDAGDLWESQK
jgi:hypothetical protein